MEFLAKTDLLVIISALSLVWSTAWSAVKLAGRVR